MRCAISYHSLAEAMLKLKLKNLTKSRRDAREARRAASEEKERNRELKKLTISAPINLEDGNSLQSKPQDCAILRDPDHFILDKQDEQINDNTEGSCEVEEINDLTRSHHPWEEDHGGEIEEQVERREENKDNREQLEEEEEEEEEREDNEEGEHGRIGEDREEEVDERDSSFCSDEENLPKLFQPSSPLQIDKNFILPDIMEETETEQSVSQRSSVLSSDGTMTRSPNKLNTASNFDPFEEAGLDVVETNFDFDDVPLPVFDDVGGDEHNFDVSGSPQDPPFLPVSPPPGPLLSPRLSVLHGVDNEQEAANLSRFSVISVTSEMAPPLPASHPPGQLIPRESMYHDSETKIDLWYELKKGRDEESRETCQPNDLKLQRDFPTSMEGDAILSHQSNSHMTSDSGFPDTDLSHSDYSTGRTAGDLLNSPYQFLSASDNKNGSTSATSYSDERTTEYSGSVGLKTNASSGSQHSPSVNESRGESDDHVATEGENPTRDVNEDGGPSIPETPGQGGSEKEASIRKTGWLQVKSVLVRKNRKVAMASKRQWKKYWAALKGASLLFYQCDEGRMDYDLPDLKLDLEQSLAHTVHDHVKRDHIFCLSTSSGNSYYMQSTSHSEVDDWITTIHCAAAVVLSRQCNKEDAITVLKGKAEELKKDIEKETKLRNLTELAATNASIRSMATDQLTVCSENIEKYRVNLYRIRCYIASLEGNELPNPQSLLASVSKPTKTALGKVGMFSVAALNAIVCSRGGLATSSSTRSLKSKLTLSSSPSAIFRRKSKTESPKRPRTPDTKRGLDISGPFPKPIITSSPLLVKERSQSLPKSPNNKRPGGLDAFRSLTPQSSPVFDTDLLSKSKRTRQRNKSSPDLRSKEISGPYPIVLTSRAHATPSPVFSSKLSPSEQKETSDAENTLSPSNSVPGQCTSPLNTVRVLLLDGKVVKVRVSDDTTTADVLEHICEKEQLNVSDHFLRLIIDSREGKCGITPAGDEIFSNFNCLEVEVCQKSSRNLSASCLSVLGRSKSPSPASPPHHILDNLICPAPPIHQMELTGEILSQLTVPCPGSESSEGTLLEASPGFTQEQIDLLLNDSREVSKLLSTWETAQPLSPTPMSREDKLRKSAGDLVETEAEYVANLVRLVEGYLEPLKAEMFLPSNEINALVGNIPEILDTQRMFLKRLQDSLKLEEECLSTATAEEREIKHAILRISRALVEFEENFREYATFCSSRQKIKRILAHDDNNEMHRFLASRNPDNLPSLNIESLFAKPMVRISRYPLFINAMMDNTLSGSEEKEHLEDALRTMTRVADFINEVQRVCETYGLVLDSLTKEHTPSEIGTSLKISQLKEHSEVVWLNPVGEQLTKGWKKGQGPKTTCLVFDSSVVLLCLDKKHRRKESKGPRELAVNEDDVKFKTWIPCSKCHIYDLPDSDGVTNMWRLQHTDTGSKKNNSYLLRSQSIQEKLAIIRTIQLCTEHHRDTDISKSSSTLSIS